MCGQLDYNNSAHIHMKSANIAAIALQLRPRCWLTTQQTVPACTSKLTWHYSHPDPKWANYTFLLSGLIPMKYPWEGHVIDYPNCCTQPQKGSHFLCTIFLLQEYMNDFQGSTVNNALRPIFISTQLILIYAISFCLVESSLVTRTSFVWN